MKKILLVLWVLGFSNFLFSFSKKALIEVITSNKSLYIPCKYFILIYKVHQLYPNTVILAYHATNHPFSKPFSLFYVHSITDFLLLLGSLFSVSIGYIYKYYSGHLYYIKTKGAVFSNYWQNQQYLEKIFIQSKDYNDILRQYNIKVSYKALQNFISLFRLRFYSYENNIRNFHCCDLNYPIFNAFSLFSGKYRFIISF